MDHYHKQLANVRDEIKTMLTDQLLPFWQGLRDDQFGGYYGYMDFDLKITSTAPKGCILNSRILWFFSNAALVLNNPELLKDAKHAYLFLKQHCLDTEHGGVFWSLSSEGEVLDDTKHTYNQAFAIYALSAYYQASKDPEALKLAQQLFHVIEEQCTDEVGYGEAYDRTFTPISNEKLSENGILASKTMNTLLHVFEAYSGLYQVAPSQELEAKMRHILEIFQTKVYNPLVHRQEVFFDANMNSLIDLQSYGHDIEAAWLIDWGTSLLQDSALSHRIYAITSDLAQSVYFRAYHKHSVWNECENQQSKQCEEPKQDRNRIWWVQAEAIVGFLNEWQKNADRLDYLQAILEIWNYINTYLVDSRPGSEWFWRVNDQGQPDSQKPMVDPWKCPYHNGRMCFEFLRRLS